MSEEEFEEKYKEVIDIINNIHTSLMVEDFVEEMYLKIKQQQKEIKKLEEQKRGLLVETYKNNDEKDKEIERLKDLLVKAGYKELILNGKEEWKKSE